MMLRRKLWAMLLAIPFMAKTAISQTEQPQAEHQHKWVDGPFYLMAAVTYEEPGFYPPQGMIKPEFCRICGLVRITPELAKAAAGKSNLNAAKP